MSIRCGAAVGFFGLHLLPPRQVLISSDQPSAAFVGQIRPGPLYQHRQSIAEAKQEKYVNEQPRQPGQEPRDMNLSEIGQGGGSADVSEVALIPVLEALGSVDLQFACDGATSVFS